MPNKRNSRRVGCPGGSAAATRATRLAGENEVQDDQDDQDRSHHRDDAAQVGGDVGVLLAVRREGLGSETSCCLLAWRGIGPAPRRRGGASRVSLRSHLRGAV